MARLKLRRVLPMAVMAIGLVSTAHAQEPPFCASQLDLVVKYLESLKPVGWVIVSLELGEQPCIFYGGEIEKGSGVAPNANTVFELASVTKIFTTAILAMHQRQESLDVSSAVKSHLPSGYKLSPKEDGVTFQQLATFTGGFHWSDPPGFDNTVSFSQSDFVKAVNNLVPKNPVGTDALPTKNFYSNSSIGFLGQILMSMDSTKGQSYNFDSAGFSSWISANLTGPLNMPDTSVEPGGTWAKGYKSPGDAEEPPFLWQPWGAAGALRSTGNDMLKFLKANICAHHKADPNCAGIPLNILDALEIAHVPNNYTPPGTQPIDIRKGTFLGKGSISEQAWAWSYLTPPNPNPKNLTPIISKDGGHPGFSSMIAFDPDTSYGLVILTNTGNLNMRQAGLNILSNTLYPASIQSIEPPEGPLEGGATVTIKGSRLSSKDTFEFGGKAIPKVTCKDTNSCSMVPPAHAPGDVKVNVKPAASDSLTLTYKYLAPEIKGFSPKEGPTTGGLSIGITGVSLSKNMTVKFGDAKGTDIFCEPSATFCSVTSPKGMMPVNVSITLDSITSTSTDQFTFVVFPTVTDVVPSTGPIGSTVEIDGTGFNTMPGGTTITFGGLVASGVACSSKMKCTAVVPGFATQSADVEVTVDGHTSLKGVTFTNSVKVPPPPPM